MTKILVADDEKEIVRLLKIYLETDGVSVLEANDGIQALEILEKNDVALALVDIMMPKLDGYQLIKKIRQKNEYIPIIVISAKVTLSDRVLGIDLGADDYIKAHIDEVVDQIIDTTEKNDAEITQDESIGIQSYWLSKDRAMLISENEANSIENYVEYREAKARGLTRKRWLTELDNKVRDTHAEIEGKTVDIDGYFIVGSSLMRFPHDYSENPDPAEIINCRCACQYE